MAELKHQISIDAKPEKVYAALVTQEGLRSWWTADSVTGGKIGAGADFGFGKRSVIFRMKIEKLEPGREVVWSCQGDEPQWNGTTLTWDLARGGDGTTVRFTHSGWKEESEMYAICNSSWGELMHRLKDYVEGRNPGPHWKE